MVSQLTSKLVCHAHKVRLFASGNSQTLTKLEEVYARALRLDRNIKDYAVYKTVKLRQVSQNAVGFDSHLGFGTLTLASLVTAPTVHNLHGIFTKDKQKVFSHHNKQL